MGASTRRKEEGKPVSAVCPACGGAKPLVQAYCQECLETEKNQYRIIREYLRSYPNSNAMQVANATGISISKITRLIREGALSVLDDDGPRRSPRNG